MSKHNEIGIKGEKIAEKFLQNNGYSILHHNWRTGSKEVDFIVQEDKTLVFIEIKTRSNFKFGFPEEAVTLKKQNHLKAAAVAYLATFPETLTVRFDVISILMERDVVKEIKHIKDAFC
jgi:putative endonuclease